MVYVYLDCNKTQDFVFSSRRLRGIRNGSRAIAQCDEEVGCLPPAMGGQTIRKLGAVVIAKFPDGQSTDRFLREARKVYQRYGIGLECARRECSTPTDFYRDVLAPLLKAIRARKDCPEVNLLAPPSTILAATCDTSGRGAAQGLVQLARREPPRRANAAEQAKWMMPKDDSDVEELVQGWTQAKMPSTAEGVVAWNSSEELEGKEVPGTSEERLLGMVFADVNGLGSLLPDLARDEAKFKTFAHDLRQCLIDSLKQALQKVLAVPVSKRLGKEQVDAVPFHLLFLGGDDLCFAAAGAYVLPLTKKFIEDFQVNSVEVLRLLGTDAPNLPSHLTLSAGVVIAPYNYPILSFRRLGQGLEARTKRMGRAWATLNGVSYPPSLVDFYLVKNDAAGTLEEIRGPAYTPYKMVDADKPAALFGGPYLISKNMNGQPNPAERFLPLEELLVATEGLAAIQAAGKFKALPLLLTRPGAQHLYREWFDHLGDGEPGWRVVCNRLGVCASRDALPVHGYPHLNTPVLDALELVPFVRLRKRWEG